MGEKLYMLLITTKTSNILEDLETLRLFARVIPEYSRSMDEADILENAFQIIFAFDEIVALGYRESVNLAQIRTFVGDTLSTPAEPPKPTFNSSIRKPNKAMKLG